VELFRYFVGSLVSLLVTSLVCVRWSVSQWDV